VDSSLKQNLLERILDLKELKEVEKPNFKGVSED
jgi:hypothetical protein